MAKTTVHKVLFLVSMDSQRSKELDGSQFWALECLLTASGWLESIRAIMAPTRVITSFQSSCEIGLRSQCTMMFLNQDQKFHTLFDIYGINIDQTVQNQPRKPSNIRLPKELSSKNCFSILILVILLAVYFGSLITDGFFNRF